MLAWLAGCVAVAATGMGCSDKEAMDNTMVENPKQIQDILNRSNRDAAGSDPKKKKSP